MTSTDQLDEADVAALRRAGREADIEQARLDGRLNELLGISSHRPPAGQWSADDVSRLYAERRFVEIEDARAAGQLTDYLNQPKDSAS